MTVYVAIHFFRRRVRDDFFYNPLSSAVGLDPQPDTVGRDLLHLTSKRHG
jgi:hypothetical protein